MIELTDDELRWLHGSLASTTVSLGNADGIVTMMHGRSIILKLEAEAKEREQPKDGFTE